jgi:hypothetical protein
VTSAYVVVGAVVACGGYFTADPGGRRDVPGVGDRRLCVSVSRETDVAVAKAIVELTKKLRTMTGCNLVALKPLSRSDIATTTVRLEVRLTNEADDDSLFGAPGTSEAIYEVRTFERRRVEG